MKDMWESHLSEYLNGNAYFGYVCHVLLLLCVKHLSAHERVFILVEMFSRFIYHRCHSSEGAC